MNPPLLATSLLSILAGPILGANSSFIDTPLTNTSVDADASGRILSSLTASDSELIVNVRNLAPLTQFDIEVGGIIEASFATSDSGKANVKFRSDKPGSRRALDFDPRGKLLRVLGGGQSVLEATLAAAGEPAGATGLERVKMRFAANGSATGSAEAQYRLDDSGRRTFRVELEGAGPGPFELFVGGVKRGDFTAGSLRSKIKFSSASGDAGVLALDFDPRGQVLDVVSGGAVLFSSELAARARYVNVAPPRLAGVSIPSTGADSDAHAEAKLRIDDRARKTFSVEVEGLPAGTYDLLVDGVDVADIAVAATADGTEGKVEFRSGDDGSDELLLTFDPVFKTLTIRQGTTVFLEGAFRPDLDDGSGAPAPEAPSELEEDLASTGLVSGAKASARYRVDSNGRHRFRLEVEKVAAGNYGVVVAGVVRGTLSAVNTSNGVKGQLEFDDKNEPGHLPLGFDPRGQLIEITSPSGVLFSHLLGSGSAPGLDSENEPATPYEDTLPLLSSGADADARAKVKLERDSGGELSFGVEAEDLTAGAYDLFVGGTTRGTLNVSADGGGTRGRLEFETDPESGESALNFEVDGQEVIISQGGTTFFSRVLPPR